MSYRSLTPIIALTGALSLTAAPLASALVAPQEEVPQETGSEVQGEPSSQTQRNGDPSSQAQRNGDPSPQAQRNGDPSPQAQRNGDPFLWHIQHNNVSGYLFGTVHLPDKRVLELAPSVEAAFAASDRFYAEIEATDASKVKIAQLAQLREGESLDQITGADIWGRVARRILDKGLTDAYVASFRKFEPWAVSAILPTLDYIEAQMKGVASLDEALYKRAIAEGKKVAGLETVEEQVNVFTSFDRTEQVRMLEETLDMLDKDDANGRDTIEETVKAWLSGDEKRLIDLLDDGFGEDPELRRRAEDELLWRRNLRFAERIEAQLTKHPKEVSFFAVGALHMPDPKAPAKDALAKGDADAAAPAEGKPADDIKTPIEAAAKEKRVRQAGLVKLLRERGYTVTRVRAAKATETTPPTEDAKKDPAKKEPAKKDPVPVGGGK